jgi:hypothetical protein
MDAVNVDIDPKAGVFSIIDNLHLGSVSVLRDNVYVGRSQRRDSGADELEGVR